MTTRYEASKRREARLERSLEAALGVSAAPPVASQDEINAYLASLGLPPRQVCVNTLHAVRAEGNRKTRRANQKKGF